MPGALAISPSKGAGGVRPVGHFAREGANILGARVVDHDHGLLMALLATFDP
jgi:hypothetical protein